MKLIVRLAGLGLVMAFPALGQTFDNGPFVTHPGAFTCIGGADASMLQGSVPPYLTQYGLGAQISLNARLADDFIVPAGQAWTLNTITVYAYQTGSTTTSTLNHGNFRIWRGPPGVAGSSILHDWSASNQMLATAFTNCYRCDNTNLNLCPGGSTRPLMSVTLNGHGISLECGTYWLDFQIGGTLSSGPFVPPITILGVGNTGNSRQYYASSNSWIAVTSGGLSKGMPFRLDYGAGLCWSVLVSQPAPGGPLTLTDQGGTPGNRYLNALTLNAGAFPNGWCFGIDISVSDLLVELAFGPPFFGTLDAGGAASFTTPGGVPAGLSFYLVGVHVDLLGYPVRASPAIHYVTM